MRGREVSAGEGLSFWVGRAKVATGGGQMRLWLGVSDCVSSATRRGRREDHRVKASRVQLRVPPSSLPEIAEMDIWNSQSGSFASSSISLYLLMIDNNSYYRRGEAMM